MRLFTGGYFRSFRHRGRVQAFFSAQCDHRYEDERIPSMRHLPSVLYEGGYADLFRSYQKIDRFVPVRGFRIETRKKLWKLLQRRKSRKYRAKEKS